VDFVVKLMLSTGASTTHNLHFQVLSPLIIGKTSPSNGTQKLLDLYLHKNKPWTVNKVLFGEFQEEKMLTFLISSVSRVAVISCNAMDAAHLCQREDLFPPLSGLFT